MHGNVISFVALDLELGVIFTGMALIAFVPRIARVDLYYPARNIASLGIPADVIADFKVFHKCGHHKSKELANEFAICSLKATNSPIRMRL
jgi:hypothetical protein